MKNIKLKFESGMLIIKINKITNSAHVRQSNAGNGLLVNLESTCVTTCEKAKPVINYYIEKHD